MPILIGLIFLALGISLAVAWLDAVTIALKGLAVLSLFFFGSIAVLVGYSEMKARREYAVATTEEGEPAEAMENTSSPG